MKNFLQHLSDLNINHIEDNDNQRALRLEELSGLKLPRSYKQFFNGYEFDTFYTNGIEFYGNTGFGSLDDIFTAIFKDKIMSSFLLKNGYLQFARPDCGSYDPICFNTNKKRGDEYEIVHICHESILCNNKIKIIKVIAPSFRHWLEETTLKLT